MAWDSTRPVPWRRLVRDWAIYVGLMSIVFVLLYRDRLSVGPFIGLLISGPIFVAFGAVLAKFGYQRRSLRDLRSETAARQDAAAQSGSNSGSNTGPRPKPAPTKRTSTGQSQTKRGSGKRR